MMGEQQTKKKKILAVVGPTASGKSRLAVELAKALGGEVISCDSMQIYRDMNVGTAKPTQEETEGIPHHLIDFADPHQAFSCADYVDAAHRSVEEIITRRKLPIFCGGTGLYLDSVLRGGFEETASDPVLRQKLLEFAEADRLKKKQVPLSMSIAYSKSISHTKIRKILSIRCSI